MNDETRRLVRARASHRCEYCGLAQQDSPLAALHIEHVIPRKHGGTDDVENLALACIDCNLRKGSNLAGIDPVSGLLTPLFHPRRDRWNTHFVWKESAIVGVTAVGRTTVAVLDLNSEDQILLRLSNQD